MRRALRIIYSLLSRWEMNDSWLSSWTISRQLYHSMMTIVHFLAPFLTFAVCPPQQADTQIKIRSFDEIYVEMIVTSLTETDLKELNNITQQDLFSGIPEAAIRNIRNWIGLVL
mmetsp:Transcript_11017/g.11025  ORF Transcript_11017/g.11025 Transcript_11017/m.11025 type:complete len:114 (+) Transcript_11017:3-344(+)